MKTISDYHRAAKAAAKQDSKEGLWIHDRKRIDKITGAMCECWGMNARDRLDVELTWENSLVPSASFNGWGNL